MTEYFPRATPQTDHSLEPNVVMFCFWLSLAAERPISIEVRGGQRLAVARSPPYKTGSAEARERTATAAARVAAITVDCFLS